MRLGRNFFYVWSLSIASSYSKHKRPSNSLRSIISLYSTRTMSAVSLDRSVEFSLSSGYENVIGVDEAGRGPLAGPVVVAACYIPREMSTSIDAVIQDSKKMNEEQREVAYKVLINEHRIKYAVSIVSHSEIDELNILQASLTGMRRATTDLLEILRKDIENFNLSTEKKGKKKSGGFDAQKYLALVDGNKVPTEMPIECKAIVKGDSRVYSIAAASIIAKVVRDHLMVDLDKEYPQYNFAKHKGYPTAEHRALVMHFGPCPYHRRSYGPVKAAEEAMEKRAIKRSLVEVSAVDANESSKKKRRSSAKSENHSSIEEAVIPVENMKRKRNSSYKSPVEVTENKSLVLRRSTRIAKNKK